MYFRGGFTFSEATTAISVFLLITSVYTSTIIKDIIANKEIDQRTRKRYSLGFVLISCIITLVFIIYLLTIIIVKAYNLGIADFDQFKVLLVLGETILPRMLAKSCTRCLVQGRRKRPSRLAHPRPAQGNGRRGLCPTVAMRRARNAPKYRRRSHAGAGLGIFRDDISARMTDAMARSSEFQGVVTKIAC